MLLLAWLAEEDDDEENEWFYNQLNREGRRRHNCHTQLVPQSFS
jgi:hypothetical protein